MTRRYTKRIVIDADVARSAGSHAATDPRSIATRDFLSAVLEICHRIVITPPIYSQWRTHQSAFSASWLQTMTEKRKTVDNPPVVSLAGQVAAVPARRRERRAMLKDVHLLEAALATDGLVASCDDTARNLFRRSSQSLPAIKKIVWVNPTSVGENPEQWLEKGAKREKARMLGT